MNKSKQINKEADTKKKGRRGKYQFLCLLSRGQPVIDATLEIKLQWQKFRSANAAEKRKIPERKHPEKMNLNFDSPTDPCTSYMSSHLKIKLPKKSKCK